MYVNILRRSFEKKVYSHRWEKNLGHTKTFPGRIIRLSTKSKVFVALHLWLEIISCNKFLFEVHSITAQYSLIQRKINLTKLHVFSKFVDICLTNFNVFVNNIFELFNNIRRNWKFSRKNFKYNQIWFFSQSNYHPKFFFQIRYRKICLKFECWTFIQAKILRSS